MNKKTVLEAISPSAWRVVRGSNVVKIYKTVRKDGYESFEARWKVGKKQCRRYRGTFEKSVGDAQEIVRLLDDSREQATEVESGHLHYLIECEKKLDGVPLHHAVDFYLAHKKGTSDVTVAAAVKEYLDEQRRQKHSSRHIETVEYHLNRFREHFSLRKLADVGTDEIRLFLERQPWADRTRNNVLGTIVAFYNAVKAKHLNNVAETAAQRVKIARSKAKTPEIFTPEELTTILACCDNDYLPYFAVAAFAGIRRAEIGRLTFEHIDWEQNLIHLNTEITKTNRRRTVDLEPCLMAWLSLFKDCKGRLTPAKNPIEPLKPNLPEGFVWKHNALRHSFASYHLAKHRNSALTSELAGHSATMLQSIYKALVTPSAAEAWFSVTPEKVREFCLQRGWTVRY